MDKITWSNIIALGSVLIGYLIMGITAFIKLNIKNTENAKDILALRNEFNEHKVTNRDDIDDVKSDIKEVKDMLKQDRDDSRKDHKEIMAEISKLNVVVSQMRGEWNEHNKK